MPNPVKSLLMTDDQPSGFGSPSSDTAGANCLHLLVSIKEKTDMNYWVHYVERLKDKKTAVKINLLHVIEPMPQDSAGHPFPRKTADGDESRATTIINEASQHLQRNDIPWQAYIRQGDPGSAILDAAEALGCHAIVLPEMKPKSWGNIFSGGVIRKVMASNRSVPVVIVDAGGIARVWRD